MKEVETTAELDAPRDLVEELLTPRDIIEYEGTYDVEDVGEASDGRPEVHASAENIDTVFAFEELPNGVAYEQTGEEPFEEQYTTITVYGEDGQVEVVARSEFTFGGRLSRIVDWFAADSRQSELKRTLIGLAKAIDERIEDDTDEAEGTADEAEGTTDEADPDPVSETDVTADGESPTGNSAT